MKFWESFGFPRYFQVTRIETQLWSIFFSHHLTLASFDFTQRLTMDTHLCDQKFMAVGRVGVKTFLKLVDSRFRRFSWPQKNTHYLLLQKQVTWILSKPGTSLMNLFQSFFWELILFLRKQSPHFLVISDPKKKNFMIASTLREFRFRYLK